MENTKFKCKCEVCQYASEVAEHLEFVHPDHREFFENLYMRYCSVGTDYEVANCIIDGTWHTSNEYIIEARKRTGIPLPIVEVI